MAIKKISIYNCGIQGARVDMENLSHKKNVFYSICAPCVLIMKGVGSKIEML